MIKIKLLKVLAVTLILFSIPVISIAQDDRKTDISTLTLEELLQLKITTAARTEEKISDIPASVMVITRADIEKYGYKNLDEVLENVPGLFGIDLSFEGKVFGVRGFWTETANNIILLINGVRHERHESDGAVYLSPTVDVSAIDRIEVVRGPMSVIYGTGAFFGAINIITNDPNSSNQISFSRGTNETTKLSARASLKKENFSMVFNGGYYNTAGPDILLSDMSSKNLFQFTPFKSTKDIWGSEVKYLNLSGSFNGFYTNFTLNQIYKQFILLYLPTSPEGSYTRVTYSSFSFGYLASLSKTFSVDAKLSYRVNATHGGFGWFIPEGKRNIGADNNDREDYEIEITSFFNPVPEIKLTSGFYYRNKIQEQLEGVYAYQNLIYRLNIIDPIESYALFSQADIRLNNWLRLYAGLRGEKAKKYSVFYQDITQGLNGNALLAQFENDDIELIPRIAAIIQIDNNNFLKLMYGKAINQPSFYKVVSEATSNQPRLKPEYITTFEINYLAAFSDVLNINTSLFYNQFDGLIVNQPIYDPYSGTWASGYSSNSGDLRTVGVELTLELNPLAGLNLEVSGTLQDTKDNRDRYTDIKAGYSPSLLGYIKAAYSFNENVSASLAGRYVGPMETLWDYTMGSNGARIANGVPGYFVLGANVRINNIFEKNIFASISINNLLDHHYLYPSYIYNSFWADKGNAGNRIEFMATIGWKF